MSNGSAKYGIGDWVSFYLKSKKEPWILTIENWPKDQLVVYAPIIWQIDNWYLLLADHNIEKQGISIKKIGRPGNFFGGSLGWELSEELQETMMINIYCNNIIEKIYGSMCWKCLTFYPGVDLGKKKCYDCEMREVWG